MDLSPLLTGDRHFIDVKVIHKVSTGAVSMLAHALANRGLEAKSRFLKSGGDSSVLLYESFLGSTCGFKATFYCNSSENFQLTCTLEFKSLDALVSSWLIST